MLILLCKVIIIITLPFTTFKTTAETALQNNAKFPNFQKSYFSNFINCTSSFDCEKTLGPSSICVPKLGQCVCKMGYEKKEKKEKEEHNNANYSATYFCEKLVCSRHSECSRIWNMARCSDSNCTCHDDSYFDLNKNYCTFKKRNKNKENENDSVEVWKWVPLASVAVIVGICIFCRCFAGIIECGEEEGVIEKEVFQPPPQRPPPMRVVCHQNQQEPSPSPPHDQPELQSPAPPYDWLEVPGLYSNSEPPQQYNNNNKNEKTTVSDF